MKGRKGQNWLKWGVENFRVATDVNQSWKRIKKLFNWQRQGWKKFKHCERDCERVKQRMATFFYSRLEE